jgi:hypothetical protein
MLCAISSSSSGCRGDSGGNLWKKTKKTK